MIPTRLSPPDARANHPIRKFQYGHHHLASTSQVSHPAFGAGIEPNAEMEVPWASVSWGFDKHRVGMLGTAVRMQRDDPIEA